MTENKRFERIYADVDVFCRDHNAKGASQLIEREDYDRIVDLLNEQHEQIERLKGNFRALDEVKCELADENEQLKKENYKLHKRLGDFEQFEEHIKERTSKTFVKECVYFDSVLGVCDIDGSVNCPCENYEELVRWIDD